MTISKMKQNVAPSCMSIKIISSLFLIITGGMLIGAFFADDLLWGGIIFVIIVVLCYLFAPIAYEINGNLLTIVSRVNKNVFGLCSQVCFIRVIKAIQTEALGYTLLSPNSTTSSIQHVFEINSLSFLPLPERMNELDTLIPKRLSFLISSIAFSIKSMYRSNWPEATLNLCL